MQTESHLIRPIRYLSTTTTTTTTTFYDNCLLPIANTYRHIQTKKIYKESKRKKEIESAHLHLHLHLNTHTHRAGKEKAVKIINDKHN